MKPIEVVHIGAVAGDRARGQIDGVVGVCQNERN